MQTASTLDILLVDDDRPLREMLTRSFEREGHRVTAVADGQAALDAAADRPYDVVPGRARAERDVEQHDVVRPRGGGRERGLAVGHGRDAMALAFEGAGEHLPQGVVVVDEEDVQRGGGQHAGVHTSEPIKGC